MAATATTFHSFSKLPLEIRNLIWEIAANLPRNLDIWAIKTGDVTYLEGDGDKVKIETFRYTTRQPIPGFLLANKESRQATSFSQYFGIAYTKSHHSGTIHYDYCRNNADRNLVV